MSEQENTNKGCGCCCSAFGKCCGPAPAEAAPSSDANTCDSGSCPVAKPEKPADSGPGCGCG
ncbi:MAG TPA: hypothetical protein VL625_10120 [Patescibacteria group bacterium]|nr:hypothetical protein [Patescibacteria group bacterium]